MDSRKAVLLSYALGFMSTMFLSACFCVGLVVGSRHCPAHSPQVQYLECTCAPCYPDRFCRKCGHVSRDCPRLEWYFKRPKFLTNGVSFTTK